jgi:hypothetical protein
MLIFCFENLQGEMELAIKHAKAALSFTRKQLTPTIRYLSEQNAMASVPDLEDEVVDVLIRWDNMFITTEYMAGERLLDIKFVDEHIEMPREFQHIQEVRNFLQKWQYRTMPYLPRLRKAFTGEADSEPPPPGPPGHYEKTLALAREWLIALQPLFTRTSANPTSRELLILALQKTSGILTYLALQRACLGDGSSTPGLFEPESVALIELGTRIVQHPFYRKAFAFDIGLIEALYLVCMVCRKREICEEALRILKLAEGRVEMMASADMFAEKSEMILQMRFPSANEEAEDVNYRDFWSTCPDWKWLL